MTALSALATRVVAEVNDATNDTVSASIAGTLYTEVQQYLVDGIRDLSNYVYREVFDNSMVTSANRRSYVVSALDPVPHMIKRLEYVRSSTDIQNIPDVELWGDSMYLFLGDVPLFQEATDYFNIWYYAQHDTPSAGSAQITLDAKDEELPIHYAKAKVIQKAALDQRGINQDTVSEFLNIAQTFERKYRDGLRRAQTSFISYKG